MRAAVAAVSLVLFAVVAIVFIGDDSRNMFAPVPATTMNSGRTSGAPIYRPALSPVEYAQYFSEPLDANVQPAYVQTAYAEPIAYGQPVEYAPAEEEGSWTTWACASAFAFLVGAAVATRRPGVVAEPDLEAAAGATRVAALAVSGDDFVTKASVSASEPTSSESESAPEPAGPASISTGRPSGYPAVWNPQNLDAPKLPDIPGAKLFEQQFVPEYVKGSPPYLTGALAGDIGFDPWCLVALAKPTKDNAMEFDKNLRTAEARKQKMLSMDPKEQARCVEWMRTAELKHARLAMLAAAGWPLAELANGGGRSWLSSATNGRAPSLFNGHLLDYWPALFVIFGGLSFLEFTTKDSYQDGNFGFDPLGIASGKGPEGASGEYIFDFKDGLPFPNAGNMAALKLAELKNGRAAMMAITGFAVSEFFWGKPVTELTPIFF